MLNSAFFATETVYHSNSVLSALSSTWSSKPPLAVRYQLDTGALQESGGSTSHGSTLERLLAWEKKLYEEVKVNFCINFYYFFIVENLFLDCC
jgi:Protein of unknown function (DUF632)